MHHVFNSILTAIRRAIGCGCPNCEVMFSREMTALKRQIEQALALFRESSGRRDDELFEMLVLRGVKRTLAARLVEFLPMAYCRVLLESSGARFSSIYRRVSKDG